MITVNNLSVKTLKGRLLVDHLSFSLNENDKTAVIGEEGNGKSTLMKILAGIDVSGYVTYTGTIQTEGKIGYLSQKMEEEWNGCTVFEYLVKKNPGDCLQPEDYNTYKDLYGLFVEVNGNPSLLEEDRIMKTLSGGEKVKVRFIKLLLQRPSVFLLDEPTNDLDLQTLIWLEEFINSRSEPILFISHDETLLENCSDSIIHLEQLKDKQQPKCTVSGSGYKEYSENRLHMIDRTNMLAAKQRAELDKQLERFRQIYQKVEHRQRTNTRQDPHTGKLLKKKMHALKGQQRILENRKENITEKYEPEESINVFFSSVESNPNKVILDYTADTLCADTKVLAGNVHLHVLGKDKICIIGPNGTGKTTLLHEVYEELKKREDLRVGYIPQNYEEVIDFTLTPVGFLLQTQKYEDRGKIQSYLGALKFTTEEMTHQMMHLSEGQKCKILLVKCILDGCNVLVLDEPTRNLSPLSNPKVREILQDYNGCILSVSHDRKFIYEVCDKVYRLDEEGLHEI